MYRGKVAPVTNYAPYHDDVWGSGGTASVVLSLGAIWTLSVIVTPSILYPEKEPWIHDAGVRVGHIAGLDATMNRKI